MRVRPAASPALQMGVCHGPLTERGAESDGTTDETKEPQRAHGQPGTALTSLCVTAAAPAKAAQT